MMANKLKIAHLNTGRGRECFRLLGEWCNQEKIDLILIQEPYLRECIWKNYNRCVENGKVKIRLKKCLVIYILDNRYCLNHPINFYLLLVPWRMSFLQHLT